MPVGKRLRYEVLKRDKFTCRYCGASAPDVHLQVDHIVPVSLGGGDTPDNLVAACVDCNSGKSSSTVGGITVQDVSPLNVEMMRAVRAIGDKTVADMEEMQKASDFLCDNWRGPDLPPMPDDGYRSIEKWLTLGLPVQIIESMMVVATDANVPKKDKWRYFCGCCWNRLYGLHEEARGVVDVGNL